MLSLDTGASQSLVGVFILFVIFLKHNLLFCIVKKHGDAELFKSTAVNELGLYVTERNSNGNTDLEKIDARVSISLVGFLVICFNIY